MVFPLFFIINYIGDFQLSTFLVYNFFVRRPVIIFVTTTCMVKLYTFQSYLNVKSLNYVMRIAWKIWFMILKKIIFN